MGNETANFWKIPVPHGLMSAAWPALRSICTAVMGLWVGQGIVGQKNIFAIGTAARSFPCSNRSGGPFSFGRCCQNPFSPYVN